MILNQNLVKKFFTLCQFGFNIAEVINRPNVAGAVLQTPSPFIRSITIPGTPSCVLVMRHIFFLPKASLRLTVASMSQEKKE